MILYCPRGMQLRRRIGILTTMLLTSSSRSLISCSPAWVYSCIRYSSFLWPLRMGYFAQSRARPTTTSALGASQSPASTVSGVADLADSARMDQSPPAFQVGDVQVKAIQNVPSEHSQRYARLRGHKSMCSVTPILRIAAPG